MIVGANEARFGRLWLRDIVGDAEWVIAGVVIDGDIEARFGRLWLRVTVGAADLFNAAVPVRKLKGTLPIDTDIFVFEAEDDIEPYLCLMPRLTV